MIPLADLLNHSRPRMCIWKYNEERNGLEIIAEKDITMGQEVTICYGLNKDNN